VFEFGKRTIRDRHHAIIELPESEEKKRALSWAMRSESYPAIRNSITLASTSPRVATTQDQWDADPWLFCVANGIIDLRTGALREGKQGDLISRQSQVKFDSGAACPTFLSTLDSIFSSDAALIDFFQRAVGYTLTGLTTEQCLFLLHGKGANGKSTSLEIVRYVLGDYATSTPFSTLEALDRGASSNDIAALAGLRFVTAIETQEGVRLNEARIKSLTGGDEVAARFLYGEFFQFHPVMKLWLAVNHLPRVRDDSEGFWRRLRLIPFTQSFTGDAADKNLLPKLITEASGILAWAVRGCLAWRRDGLKAPKIVSEATSEYREESDPLNEFIEERCEVGEGKFVRASDFYLAYVGWASSRGMTERDRLGSTGFGTRMTDKFTSKKGEFGKTYFGVSLRVFESEQSPDG
jgi:putative DNA primase/helicase